MASPQGRIDANPKDVEAYLLAAKDAFASEKYADADKILANGVAQAEALVKTLNMWRRKCQTHLDDASPAPAPAATEVAAQSTPAPAPATEAQPSASSAAPAADATVAAAPAAPAAPADVRVDWFQTASNVTVCFFIRMGQQMAGSTDHAAVAIAETSLGVAIKLKDGSSFTWKASPLYGEIDVATSTFTQKHMKVEAVLTKKAHGENWEALEGTGTAVFPDKPGAYPTSSKKGKDWTRYEVDADDDKPEGQDALNHLLQDIYGKGDDETRKAMNKSFVESGGTVLSTNWNEIGKGKVECQAPKGMEAKTWKEG